MWGSNFGSFSDDNLHSVAKSVVSLTKSTKILESILNNQQNASNPLIQEICKDIEKVYSCLIKLLRHMEDRNENVQTESQSSMISSQGLTNRTCFEYTKAGFLLPLYCGHSGSYSTSEKSQYEKHLVNVKFINTK